jgi:hypothetical protein
MSLAPLAEAACPRHGAALIPRFFGTARAHPLAVQRWQARHVFRTLDIRPQSDKLGFIGYLFAYHVLISAAALRGYGQYLVGSGRRWK